MLSSASGGLSGILRCLKHSLLSNACSYRVTEAISSVHKGGRTCKRGMGRCEWGGRISDTKGRGGGQRVRGLDGSVVVQGEAEEGDVLACRMKRLARKL